MLHYFDALQVQHETLLRVRKEGNAHDKYNSFRSAFEILETIGKPPADDIEKHYQRPMSLLDKVERLEQELAIPGMLRLCRGQDPLRD